jgi:chemotaxis protein MotB
MAAKGGKRANDRTTVIVRREEGGEAGHHGGAWKVAYADFVTAMMAFFLLMWLLNATTDQQKRGIANYFSPTNALGTGTSGSGLPFGGKTPFSDGEMVSDLGTQQVIQGPNQVANNVRPDATRTPARPDAVKDGTDPIYPGEAGHTARTPSPAPPKEQAGGAPATAVAPNAGATQAPVPAAAPSAPIPSPAEAARVAEQAAFTSAAAQIRAAIGKDPALAGLARQIAVDVTPEGLRIQLLDEDHQPMFATGSAEPNERARALIARITPVLARLTEPVTIAGYTDAAPYRGTGRTNWDLSADRANATRRLLEDAGLTDRRILGVTGHADHDLLLPAQPLAAANRRIAILVHSQAGKAAATAPPARAANPLTATAPAASVAPHAAAELSLAPQPAPLH